MSQTADESRPGDASDATAAGSEPAHVEDVGRPSAEDERVAALLEHTIDLPVLAEAVEQQEAADAADTLEDLEEPDRVVVLEQMEDEPAAEALAEMNRPLAVSILKDLVAESKTRYAGRLLERMAPDDAADLLQALENEERQALLAGMPTEPAGGLVQLIAYDEESAGGLMTTDFIALRDDMTVQEATDFIRQSDVPDHTRDALVTDRQTRLVGVVGLRRLLLARPEESVASLMETSIDVLRPDMDREHVAKEFDRYDLEMLPVVDEQDHLLGIVTVDDVIDIIRVEQTEDVQKTVGAGAGEAVYSTLLEKFRGRFPWLGLSLVLTCSAAIVVLVAESMIQRYTILAFLLPVIAALVGNAGHQSLAVTLRGIVLEEVRRERVGPLVAREAAVGALMGLVLGAMICLLVTLLSPLIASASWRLGLVAGTAAMVSMCAGTLAGSSIPLIMRRLGFDPAQASAIFLIMITDGVAFAVLLGLTWLLLGPLDPA